MRLSLISNSMAISNCLWLACALFVVILLLVCNATEMNVSKEPIRLRKRKMPSGLTSLYLDIYLKGKRSYEYLRLYLVPEKSRADKEKNRTTMQLAEDIRAKRMVELRNGEYGFKTTAKEDTLFYPYFRAICEAYEKKGNKGTIGNWYSCLRLLQMYDDNEKLSFRDITPNWLQGFKNYLDTKACAYGHERDGSPLKQNTKAIYFNKLNSCLRMAHKNGIIAANPMQGVESYKAEECSRMYLTIDEVRRLAVTKCSNDRVRRSFLFSCLTGLRYSDIKNLTWGEVMKQGEFTRIVFKQKKTGGQEYLDISTQAESFMGEHGSGTELVFVDMPDKKTINKAIQQWVNDAGIGKHITFHCARHTFAVMMLDLGTDIYTVSKLLGHRSIATTQIYAKVLDKNKQAAVQRIPNILDHPALS